MANRKVNSITYGAVICALIGMVLFLNRQTAGFLNDFLLWIIPLPIIVYSVKFDSKQTLIVDFCALLLAVIVTGFDIKALFYTFASLIAGTVYGYGVNKGKSAIFLIGSVIIVSLFILVITTYVFAQFFGYDFIFAPGYIQSLIDEVIPQVLEYSLKIDPSLDVVAIEELLRKFMSVEFMIGFWLVIDIVSSVLEGILVHMLAYLVLRRLKMKLPPMRSIAEIYAPTWLKLLTFGVICAQLFAKFTAITQYDNIITPLYLIICLVSMFFGYLHILTFLSLSVRDRKKIALILLALFVFIFVTYRLFVIIGMIDIFTNTRKTLVERAKSYAQQNKQA